MPGAKVSHGAVLDASVAVRLFVPEVGSAEAAEQFARPFSWIAPKLLVTEIASALRRKVSAGVVRQEFAVQALEAFRQMVYDGNLRFAADELVVGDALMLALTKNHTLPDCMYLALAQREGASLATADRALARVATECKVNVLYVHAA